MKNHISQNIQMMQLDLSEVEKSKKFDFSKNILFLAISKLRLSTYTCTPSGTPKLKFWLSLPIPKLFSYPLEKLGCLKSQLALATARQGSIALLNIFFANFSVKKGSKSDRITRFFALNFIKKYCLQGAEQF